MIKNSIPGSTNNDPIPFKELYTNEELSKLVDIDYRWTQQNAAAINANAQELKKLKEVVQFGFVVGLIGTGVKIYHYFKKKASKEKKEESV